MKNIDNIIDKCYAKLKFCPWLRLLTIQWRKGERFEEEIIYDGRAYLYCLAY